MNYKKIPICIDPHVHLRDPGATKKETFFTGTCAAAAGGIGIVLDMPNNPIPTISQKTLHKKNIIASEKAVVDYGLIFGASQDDNTKEYSFVKNAVAGIKVYMDTTTGNLLLEQLDILKKVFSSWKGQGPIIVHAEEATLTKALALSYLYNKHLHIAHLSTKEELELVIAAKQKGIKVTCEVTPHHLFLTKRDAKHLKAYGKMKPPLRDKKDINFLWKHLDAIDCIATDHAPHTKEEKDSFHPPFGVPGLETSLPLMLNAYSQKRISLSDIVRLMHDNPKKIFNITTDNTSYVLVDVHKRFTIENKNLYTKCGWSPFNGISVKGKVVQTTLRNTIVYDGENIKVKKGFGKNIYES